MLNLVASSQRVLARSPERGTATNVAVFKDQRTFGAIERRLGVLLAFRLLRQVVAWGPLRRLSWTPTFLATWSLFRHVARKSMRSDWWPG